MRQIVDRNAAETLATVWVIFSTPSGREICFSNAAKICGGLERIFLNHEKHEKHEQCNHEFLFVSFVFFVVAEFFSA